MSIMKITPKKINYTDTMEVTRIEYFECVLSLIQNKDIKDLCQLLLENADEYFFIEPASSSGKYHPKYAHGEGGLARHSMAVALIMHEILETECYNFTDREKDLLITAAIVHDIKKYGNGRKYVVRTHPELAVEYIDNNCQNTEISSEELNFLKDAVVSHMGKYGRTKPETDAQKLLHISDCLASRRYLNVDFDSEDIQGSHIVNESTVKLEEPEIFIFNFGKHKGKTIDEVYSTDPQYLTWLTTKFEGNPGPVIKKVERFLEKKNKK